METTRDPFSMSRIDLVVEILALLTLLAGAGLVALRWFALPDPMPMHFDMEGTPDRHGSKLELWALVGVFVLTWLSMAVPARLLGLMRRARGQDWVTLYWPQARLLRSLILWFNAETMLVFFALIHGTLAVALGRAPQLALTPMYSLLGVMAITFVIWMGLAIPVTLREIGAKRR